MKKPKDHDVHYEAYGRFKTPKMLYPLSVTESFSDLGNAKHCAAMLKRGGCVLVSVHRVKTMHPKKTYIKVRIAQ